MSACATTDQALVFFLGFFLVVLGFFLVVLREVLGHEHELALRVVLFHLAAEGLLAGELVPVQLKFRESQQLRQLSWDVLWEMEGF